MQESNVNRKDVNIRIVLLAIVSVILLGLVINNYPG
jgi:hypothetical protein